MLNFCYPQAEQKPSQLNLAQLLALLRKIDHLDSKQLLPTLEQQLDPLESLSQEHYAQLRFCEQLFSNYCLGHKLAGEIQQALNPLLLIMADLQLNNAKWAWQPHPFIDLLANIQQHCIGWYANDNRASQRFLQQLQQAIAKLITNWQQDKLDYQHNSLKVFFEQHDARISKLEQRVIAAESGALKAKRSQQMATRIINEKMEQQLLPSCIQDFLQNSWHESIILLLINSENMQAEFHRLKKLTETFIWTFKPYDPEDNDTQQRIYRVIGHLQEELAENLASLKHQPDKLASTLATIESQHLRILKGEAIERSPCVLLDNNPLNDSHTKISGNLLKKVNQLKPQLWLSHKVDGQVQAIKLLLKLSDSQQLLFSNYLGVKACQYSYEEMAYKLSNNSITALPHQCRIMQTASILLEKLLSAQQQALQKNLALANEKKKQQQAQVQQRLADQKKALAEAQALAQQKQRQQERLAAVRQPELSFNEQQKYSLLLHKLNTGGRVRFYRNGQARECKLAAITKQASNYIFVNQQGIKDCEVLKQELIAQLATKQAEILDNGDHFEDALSKVVNSIRNRK
ncbi:DUF1631 domain-containing protein [Dasania sp. GY-MA-18]|uniref:DUF1631 domain-containing protein n=1 Tax=Dasania phycosphaerae TaxID=2950436 RepID=A0A9J6RJK8_9GAMM|nr:MULTISPECIES: DUF1631 domain-containing protein [Dasania]MCR8922231.1 DUF1631 domain-containing protein [Dasania sp. GY-MA-18]MCZ0864659.1 DUF1631 domain-containing protein [Dasania phycosphaerae]MCZ0868387.1 DUF1631 domain-containing protein [Dasania phycosphaerae]